MLLLSSKTIALTCETGQDSDSRRYHALTNKSGKIKVLLCLHYHATSSSFPSSDKFLTATLYASDTPIAPNCSYPWHAPQDCGTSSAFPGSAGFCWHTSGTSLQYGGQGYMPAHTSTLACLLPAWKKLRQRTSKKLNDKGDEAITKSHFWSVIKKKFLKDRKRSTTKKEVLISC